MFNLNRLAVLMACGIFASSALSAPLAVSPSAVTAQNSAAVPAPYRAVSVKGDAGKVLLFISFSCEFCRASFSSLARWGASLPKEMAFDVVPVPLQDNKNSIIAARAWRAAQMTGATQAQMTVFGETVYAVTGKGGLELSDPAVWLRAADAAHILTFRSAWEKVTVKDIRQMGDRAAAYAVDATPSLAVGGRYVITPDNTTGDMAMFLKLANGVTSLSLYDKP